MAIAKGTGILVSAVLVLVCIEVVATLQCYSCPASKTENECVKISPCAPDEVCLLRRTTDNDTQEIFYESRCETQSECDRELTRYQTILTALVGRKREITQVLHGDVCLIQCCDNDLCNNGCVKPSDLPFAAATTATPSNRPPIPTASNRPPIPTASNRPPIPTASTRPPIPTASTRPPIPTASNRPPIPTASTRPPIPTASTSPPIPTASTRPPLPTQSTRPPLPTQSTRPPLPTQSTRPPLPTQSTRPPLPTQSTRPPLPTQSTRPPLPVFITSLQTFITSLPTFVSSLQTSVTPSPTFVTNLATSNVDNNLSTQGKLTDLTSKGELIFPTKPHKTSTKIMSVKSTISSTNSIISSGITAPRSTISSATTASSSTISSATTQVSSATLSAPGTMTSAGYVNSQSTTSSLSSTSISQSRSTVLSTKETNTPTTHANDHQNVTSTTSSLSTSQSNPITPSSGHVHSTRNTFTKPVCPDGSVAFENSCYYFVRHEMSFRDAENLCAKYHSHLVHVDTAKENEFLKKHLTNLRRGPTQFWIGITDEDTENVWKFYDNQKLANFFDWSPGEPDGKQAFDGNALADCAVFDPFLNFQWRDEDCSPYQYSVPICEIGN